MATDLSRGARGPGPFTAHPSGVGVGGLGERSLAAPFPPRMFTRRAAQGAHQGRGVRKTREGPQLGTEGASGGELDAAQRLHGFDDGSPAPGRHQGREVGFQALPAFGLLGEGPAVCLAAKLWGWRRTAHGG